jgi:hypothetical protein
MANRQWHRAAHLALADELVQGGAGDTDEFALAHAGQVAAANQLVDAGPRVLQLGGRLLGGQPLVDRGGLLWRRALSQFGGDGRKQRWRIGGVALRDRVYELSQRQAVPPAPEARGASKRTYGAGRDIRAGRAPRRASTWQEPARTRCWTFPAYHLARSRD